MPGASLIISYICVRASQDPETVPLVLYGQDITAVLVVIFTENG